MRRVPRLSSLVAPTTAHGAGATRTLATTAVQPTPLSASASTSTSASLTSSTHRFTAPRGAVRRHNSTAATLTFAVAQKRFCSSKGTEKDGQASGESTEGSSESAEDAAKMGRHPKRPTPMKTTEVEGKPGSMQVKPDGPVAQEDAKLGAIVKNSEREAFNEIAAPPQINELVDNGPLRATGLWSVKEVEDEQQKTIDFRRIDDVESDIVEDMVNRDTALVAVNEEDQWKHKLMFNCKFNKTPKHLTWKEFGQEVECLDCVIDLHDHKPEEIFEMKFYFRNKATGVRDLLWSHHNDASKSEGLTDLLAAIGSCLGRADVHRTIRFDDGVGSFREITIKKNSRYTSDLQLAFRPATRYDLYERTANDNDWEKSMADAGLNTWGFHPSLMDPEYRDSDDPPGTHRMTMSAHAFSFIVLQGVERLLARPMKDFYRPSQIAKSVVAKKEEDIGLNHAVMGWLGAEQRIYPHYTPMEAIQDHWLGNDAPFSLTAIVNKLREMTYLKKRNPEFQSWLATRKKDTALAIRNVNAKLLGAGASPLFAPLSHNATTNQLLPKHQRRNLTARVSVAGAIGMPDETRRIGEVKKLAQTGALPEPENRELRHQGATLPAPAAEEAKKKLGSAIHHQEAITDGEGEPIEEKTDKTEKTEEKK